MKKTHTMDEMLDPVGTMERNAEKFRDPLTDERKKLAHGGDFIEEANAATERGRAFMRGETPALLRGKKVLAAIKEAEAGKTPREKLAAARRGLRSFPPARQVT